MNIVQILKSEGKSKCFSLLLKTGHKRVKQQTTAFELNDPYSYGHDCD